MIKVYCILSMVLICAFVSNAQPGRTTLNVIAYYSGDENRMEEYPVEKLTHIIYSFCHLKGNRLYVNNKRDTLRITNLVKLKRRNPKLKVMLSLGGWGGCRSCSDVFDTEKGRKEFASSVKEVNNYFKTDGIDMDWEYPAIEGYPEHPFKPADRDNFTALRRDLRDSLGKQHEISFAAGGFQDFLDKSIDWVKIAALVDRINLMSYDLVNGNSVVTGHHTPLYSTPQQKESADNAITWLGKIGVPMNKIVIGAAFYGRSWENVIADGNGIYQSGKFKSFISYRSFDKNLSKDDGFEYFFDSVARAPYAYNKTKKIFATFDDPVSIKEKTEYALAKGLNGIMFWELTLDKTTNGLLEVISDQLK